MLDSSSGFVSENNSLGPINLSSEGWSPEPGVRDLTVRLIDGRGVLTSQISKSFEIRRTDWNVGINKVELEGEEILKESGFLGSVVRMSRNYYLNMMPIVV